METIILISLLLVHLNIYMFLGLLQKRNLKKLDDDNWSNMGFFKQKGKK